MGALGRRTTWPSRAAALELFQKSPFFAILGPARARRVRRMRAVPRSGGRGVRLKMSGVQEAVVFSECHTENEGIRAAWYARSAHSTAVGDAGAPWCARGRSPNTVHTRVWVRRANATNVRISGGGHLVCVSPRHICNSPDFPL